MHIHLSIVDAANKDSFKNLKACNRSEAVLLVYFLLSAVFIRCFSRI